MSNENKVDQKKLNKLIGDLMFEEPVVLADGTLSTPRWKTGLVAFDALLNGGLPRGKAIAIGTEEGVGKTTMILQGCFNIIEQYPESKVYYCDAEGGASFELIESMGFADLLYHPKKNPKGRFFLLNTSTIQQISAVLKIAATDPNTAVFVIDSDTMVVDQRDLDDDALGTNNKAAALNARMWSSVAGAMLATVKASEMCLIFIHQARTNLSGFNARTEASACRAIRHAVSAEIWGKRKHWLAPDRSFTHKREGAIGVYIQLTTSKNRLTKPFATVEFPIFFGLGASNIWSYKDWLMEHNITDPATGEVKPYVEKAGSWFTLNLPSGTHRCQGEAKLMDLVEQNYDEIVSIVDNYGGVDVGTNKEYLDGAENDDDTFSEE